MDDLNRRAEALEQMGVRDPLPGRLFVVHVLDIRPRHGGVDGARADRVDPDIVGGQVNRHAAGQIDQPALGRPIGRHGGIADNAAGRRNVDDGAGLLGHHVRDDGLTHQERAGQVNTQNPVPLLQAGVLDGFAQNDPGVVVQDIDPAKGGQTALGQTHRRGFLGNIASLEHGLAAVGIDRGRHPLALFAQHVAQQQPGALLGKRLGGDRSLAARRSGQNDRFSIQAPHAFSSCSCWATTCPEDQLGTIRKACHCQIHGLWVRLFELCLLTFAL